MRLVIDAAIKVVLHVESVVLFIFTFVVFVVVFFVILLILFFTLVILETLQLFLMLDLIGDILFTTFAVAEAAAVLLSICLQVTGWLLLWLILVFLTAEALIDKVNERALAQVTELCHAMIEGSDSLEGILEARCDLLHGITNAFNALPCRSGYLS